MFLNNRILIIIFLISCLSASAFFVIKNKNEANGRIQLWGQVVKDIKGETEILKPIKKPLTGYGAGSYQYIFRSHHKSTWNQAHNEYLEFAYNNGLIGFCLMLASIFSVLSLCFQNWYHKYIRTLFASFIVICLMALTTFVWQLHAHIFYTVVIVGLIYGITGGNNEQVG